MAKRFYNYSRTELEELHWTGEFLPWLKEVGFDPRNNEDIDTLFWYWFMQNKYDEYLA